MVNDEASLGYHSVTLDPEGVTVTAEAPHRIRTMRGRDPRESHRASTPLELLYDLTFAVAFGVAGSQLAHYLAEGHFQTATSGFLFAMWAICWTWVNFSWFASAFDTDDWAYRLAVMVQMVGVIILTLGLPVMYTSFDGTGSVNNGTMVLGYVVMRVGMVYLWLRAARDCPELRSTCLTYAGCLVVAQVGWIALAFVRVDRPTFLVLGFILMVIELVGPVIAETRKAGGTPWHAHHIAERYSLLTIITLGEGIIGTVASLSVLVELDHGWTPEAFGLAFAGIALTLGMWWGYFAVDPIPALEAHRDRSFGWGYGHLLIFTAIAATGAGLHVAAYYLEHQSHLSAFLTVLAVVFPVGLFVMTLFGLYYQLYRQFDLLHGMLLVLTMIALAVPLGMAASGVAVQWCLMVLCLAPMVTVIGYEGWGHRHMAAVLANLQTSD